MAKTFYRYDQKPRYFVYGGFVFTPSRVPEYCLSRKDFDKQEQQDKYEHVVITKVLASSSNVGFHDLVMRVHTVNGETYDDFKAFYRLVQQATGPFVMLENAAGFQVAIDRQVASAEHDELLKRYHMETGQSDDLVLLKKHLAEVTKP